MGTDVALMLGIAHTLVENGWQDEAFLARCTTGYDRFADYLLGTTDGTAKTAEWAAEICGVSAVKIRELAEIFHHNTTMLMAGWGMQRQQFGEQKHWMIVTLAAMLGQIGTPGGGFGFSYHFANGGNPTRRAAVLASMQGSIPGGVDAVDKIPVARIVEALENPGGFYQHNDGSPLPGYSFYLVGGRRELYPSSGYQPSDSRVAKTGTGRYLGMFLDGRRETRGYCSACDHQL